MGVHGLWELLAPVGRRVSIDTLANKKVAVDASIWIVQFLKAMRDDSGDMIRNAHLIGFFRRICKLLFLRVKPIFVFDGGTPALKKRTVLNRRKQRNNAQAQIRKMAEKLLLIQLRNRHLEEMAGKLEQNKKQNSKSKRKNQDESAQISSQIERQAGSSQTDMHSKKQSNSLTTYQTKDQTEFIRMETDEIENSHEFFDKSNANENDAIELDSEEKNGLYFVEMSNDGSINSNDATHFQKNENKDKMKKVELMEMEENDDDDDGLVIMDDDYVDPTVLASLPPSIQLELMVQMRERQAAENREKFKKFAKQPASFSALQLQSYLKTVKMRKEIDNVQKNSANQNLGEFTVNKISSETNREFIYSSSFFGPKESLKNFASMAELDQPSMISSSPSTSFPSNSLNESSESLEKAKEKRTKPSEISDNSKSSPFYDKKKSKRPEGRYVKFNRERKNSRMTRDLNWNLYLMKENEVLSQNEVDENEKNKINDKRDEFNDENSNDTQNEIDKHDSEKINVLKVVSATDDTNKTQKHAEEQVVSLNEKIENENENYFKKSTIFTEVMDADAEKDGLDNQKVDDDNINLFDTNTRNSTHSMDKSKILSQLEKYFEENYFENEMDRREDGGVKVSEDKDNDDEDKDVEWEENSECMFQSKTKENVESSERNSNVVRSKTEFGEPIVESKEHEIKFGDELRYRIKVGNDVDKILESKEIADVAPGVNGGLILGEHQELYGEQNKIQDQETDQQLHQGKEEQEEYIEWEDEITESKMETEEVEKEKEIPKLTILKEEGKIEAHEFNENVMKRGDLAKDEKDNGNSLNNIQIENNKIVNDCTKINDGNVDGDLALAIELSLRDSRGDDADTMVTPKKFESIENTKNCSEIEAAAQELLQEKNILKENVLNQLNQLDDVGIDMDIDIDEELDKIFSQRNSLLKDEKTIREKYKKLEKNAENITAEMLIECQDLLRLFGIPFIISPQEAESQCAFLNYIDIVDGVITDDSDVFLFGAKTVYKNIFDEKKYIEVYLMKDVEKELGLDRMKLIKMALLLGSDYTEGINGIGIVNAMEVMNSYEGENGLEEFRNWVLSPDEKVFKKTFSSVQNSSQKKQKAKVSCKEAESQNLNDSISDGNDDKNEDDEEKKIDSSQNDTKTSLDDKRESGFSLKKQLFQEKHRKISKNWGIPENFPNPMVINAYLSPQIDNSATNFSWGKPNLYSLQQFCFEKFLWTKEKANELLIPVLKASESKWAQMKMENYFSFDERFAKFRSKRIQSAVKGITGAVETDIFEGNVEPEVVKSTPQIFSDRGSASKKRKVSITFQDDYDDYGNDDDEGGEWNVNNDRNQEVEGKKLSGNVDNGKDVNEDIEYFSDGIDIDVSKNVDHDSDCNRIPAYSKLTNEKGRKVVNKRQGKNASKKRTATMTRNNTRKKEKRKQTGPSKLTPFENWRDTRTREEENNVDLENRETKIRGKNNLDAEKASNPSEKPDGLAVSDEEAEEALRELELNETSNNMWIFPDLQKYSSSSHFPSFPNELQPYSPSPRPLPSDVISEETSDATGRKEEQKTEKGNASHHLKPSSVGLGSEDAGSTAHPSELESGQEVLNAPSFSSFRKLKAVPFLRKKL